MEGLTNGLYDILRKVGGTWLATQKLIADKQWDVITANVKAALAKAAY